MRPYWGGFAAVVWIAALSAGGSAARWDLRKVGVEIRASSEENNGQLAAANAFDGNTGSRWSSHFSDPQWIQIRFEKQVPIDEVEVWWEAACASDYRIEVSDDGKTWTKVHEVSGGRGGNERFEFKDVRATYLRLYGVKRATEWGYSIFELIASGDLPDPEPEYAGLIKEPPPPPVVTIYDQLKAELDPMFRAKLESDPPTAENLSDDEFLDLIQRRAFDYYWYEVDPESLFPVDSLTWKTATSTAAVGFALAAYVVGHEREYRPRQEIYARVEKLVDHVWDDPADPGDLCIEHMSGHPYHWTNIRTGRWEEIEGIITHDSMKLFCGMILIKHYFKGTKAGDIAEKYLDAIDWPWLVHGVKNRQYLSNFFTRHSDPSGPGDVLMYDGMKLDYLVPMGAAKGVAAYFWDNWAMSYPWDDYRGHFWRIQRPAIWIHQWDNVWFDFRNLRDAYADYHQNSVEATLANRQWCIDSRTYNESLWGINPCAGPGPAGGEIYGNFGAPPDELPFQNGKGNDGTIAPTAALPSIIFTPKESIAVARYLYDRYRRSIWGRYGFMDAINPSKNWVSKNVIGIDQGPILTNIENYRTGLIWKYFAMEDMVWRGLDKAGFVGVIDNFDPSEHSPPYAVWVADNRRVSIRKQSDEVKEAEHALKVQYKLEEGASASFVARPARRDFSRWRYLSFWQKGGPDLAVTLSSETGAEIALDRAAVVEAEGGWRKVYFSVPPEFVREPALEVWFSFTASGKGEFYLDAVFLTNDLDRTPQPFLLDDFEAAAPAEWVVSDGIRVAKSAEKARGGAGALKVEVRKTGDDDKWAHLKIKPRVRDWRRFHSVSLWVYGQAEILLKLADASGRSNDAWIARAPAAGRWNHVFFNIQRNTDPKKAVWDGVLYDKTNIAELMLFIEPGKPRAKADLYIDDLALTD